MQITCSFRFDALIVPLRYMFLHSVFPRSLSFHLPFIFRSLSRAASLEKENQDNKQPLKYASVAVSQTATRRGGELSGHIWSMSVQVRLW